MKTQAPEACLTKSPTILIQPTSQGQMVKSYSSGTVNEKEVTKKKIKEVEKQSKHTSPVMGSSKSKFHVLQNDQKWRPSPSIAFV